MTTTPSVLFVCVKNGGKSQMAAGLMRHAAGTTITVDSAGTKPGTTVNALADQSLQELGVDITAETPKAITERMVRDADVVITLGREAHVEAVAGTRVESWDTDEPSLAGHRRHRAYALGSRGHHHPRRHPHGRAAQHVGPSVASITHAT